MKTRAIRTGSDRIVRTRSERRSSPPPLRARRAGAALARRAGSRPRRAHVHPERRGRGPGLARSPAGVGPRCPCWWRWVTSLRRCRSRSWCTSCARTPPGGCVMRVADHGARRLLRVPRAAGAAVPVRHITTAEPPRVSRRSTEPRRLGSGIQGAAGSTVMAATVVVLAARLRRAEPRRRQALRPLYGYRILTVLFILLAPQVIGPWLGLSPVTVGALQVVDLIGCRWPSRSESCGPERPTGGRRDHRPPSHPDAVPHSRWSYHGDRRESNGGQPEVCPERRTTHPDDVENDAAIGHRHPVTNVCARW